MLKKYFIYFIILLAGALRLAALLKYGDFWTDEMFSFTYSQKSWIPSLTQFWIWETNPPLHMVFLKLWFYIFPANEFWARLPSVIFGTLNVWLIYILSKKYFSERAALLSSLALAISSYHIFFSATARGYSLLALLATLSFYLTLEIFYQKRASAYLPIAYALTQILFLYTHLTAGIIIAGEFLLVCLWNKNDWKKWLKYNLISGTIWLIWAIPAGRAKIVNERFGQSWFLNLQNSWLAKFEQLKLIVTGPTDNLYAALITGTLLIALIYYFYHLKKKNNGNILFFFATLLTTLPIITAIFLQTFNIKFIFVALPFLTLVIAFLADVYLKKWGIILILLVCLPGNYNLISNILPINDWKSLDTYMQSRYQPEKRQLLIYTNFTIKNELDRYYSVPVATLPYTPVGTETNWDKFLINNNYVHLSQKEADIYTWIKTNRLEQYDKIFVLDGIFHHLDLPTILEKNGWHSAEPPADLPILDDSQVFHYTK